jgi:hypothetical protein
LQSRFIVVAAAAFAAAFPVSTASAKPKDKGKSDKAEKVKQDNSDHGSKGGQGGNENVPPGQSGKPVKWQNLLLKGTVSAVDVTGGLVTVTVTSGNHAAMGLAGQSLQFNVSTAINQISDSTGDGLGDLNDVVVGDVVMVHAHVVLDAAEVVSGAAQTHVAKQFKDEDIDTPVPDPLPPEGTTP